MILNNKQIDEALQFYNIQNEEYKEKCYGCVKYINENIKLKEKVENVYYILYLDNTDKIRDLWKNKANELFGEKHHIYITNVLLLSGYKIHEQNMKKYNLDEEQIRIHKNRVKEELTKDIFERGYNQIRISQMLWGAYFVTLRLIEVGRLQYELANINPINEMKEKCIKIHIPSGESLDINDVRKSLSESKEEIKKYFNLENTQYFCSSWLLSKQIRKIVNENSNIAKFSDLFNILKERNGIEDILEFVYNLESSEDYTSLPEKTSLQKKIKQMLLKNEEINIGIGVLKK